MAKHDTIHEEDVSCNCKDNGSRLPTEWELAYVAMKSQADTLREVCKFNELYNMSQNISK